MKVAAVLIAAVLILLYLTLVSAPKGPPTGVEHNVVGATESCTEAVKERMVEANFPFTANAEYLGDRRYRLHGIVDAQVNDETSRRNYECFVQYEGSGAYTADSVSIWQSH